MRLINDIHEELGSIGGELQRRTGLNLEMANQEHVLRGAQLLADLLATHDLPNEEVERQAPRTIVSILDLTDARLQQLRRVIRGEEAVASGLPSTHLQLVGAA